MHHLYTQIPMHTALAQNAYNILAGCYRSAEKMHSFNSLKLIMKSSSMDPATVEPYLRCAQKARSFASDGARVRNPGKQLSVCRSLP